MAQKYLRSCIRIISTYQDHQKRKCYFKIKLDHKADLFIFFEDMKKLIINLLEEWIEEKEERILTIEHDKAIYHSNYRY